MAQPRRVLSPNGLPEIGMSPMPVSTMRAECPSAAASSRGPEIAELSAVICTRNRTLLLQRALASLLDQDLPPAELLVIDNAPASSATRDLLHARFPQVRYVHESIPGLDMARNRALREARHAIVAFLDDDAVADRGWARAIAQVFEDERVGVCTGRVEALTLDTAGQRLFEANGGFSRGQARIRLPEDARRFLHGWRAPMIAWAVSVGNGASFAVRRALAMQLGGFDEALDLGEPLPGGGDLDMFWRALAVGRALVYEPTVVAWHEHRTTCEEVAQQLAGHQRALVAFLCKTAHDPNGQARLPILGFLAWRLVKPGVRLVRRALGRDPLPARALWSIWAAALQGVGAYPAARRIANRRRTG